MAIITGTIEKIIDEDNPFIEQEETSEAISSVDSSIGSVSNTTTTTGTIELAEVTTESVTSGFCDPTGTYPTTYREGESDWHRLTGRPSGDISTSSTASATIENQSSYDATHIQTRNENLVGVAYPVTTASRATWEEPASDKNTTYGDTYVISTHGGVSMELDSTSGAQAWRVTHPSNSYMEINGSGDFIQKTYSSRYDIIANEHKIYCNSNRFVSIQGIDDLRVQLESIIERVKDKKETCLMNSTLIVSKAYTKNIGGDDTTTIGGNRKSTISGQDTLSVSSSSSISIGSTYSVSIGSSATLSASGTFAIKGSIIMLN